MNEQNRYARPKTEWKEGARFTEEGITLLVSVAQGFRPRFSVQVGREREDGSFIPHVPVSIDGTFQIKVTPLSKVLGSLGEKVEEWISTRAAMQLDDRIAREEKQANFGKHETRITGKTAKKKAKLGRADA